MTRTRSGITSDTCSSSQSDTKTAGESSTRRTRRGKHTETAIVAVPRDKGGPPLKVGSSPLFDSTSSESSDADPDKAPLKPVLQDTKTEVKREARPRREIGSSPVTSCSPCSGRRYSFEIEDHSSWDDADWDREKRRLHNIRRGYVKPKPGLTNPPFNS